MNFYKLATIAFAFSLAQSPCSMANLTKQTIDLKPTELKFIQGNSHSHIQGKKKSLEKMLNVELNLASLGERPYRNRAVISVLIKGQTYSGEVYAPETRGRLLGGPLFPGETGTLTLSLPLGTLQHCERVKVQIDTTKSRQIGPKVFENDLSELVATEMQNTKVCSTQSPAR